MKQLTLILFLIFTTFYYRTIAQLLPDIKVRALQPSFYETLKTDYLIKTTKNYQLNGNVKCVNETIIAKQNGPATKFYGPSPGFVKTIKYEFLENNRLILYMEDTLQSLKYSNAKIEKYFFDEAGEKLFKVELYSGIYQTSKTLKKIDPEGFIFQEVYK